MGYIRGFVRGVGLALLEKFYPYESLAYLPYWTPYER